MVGIALWHFTVLLPDNFAGGIIGAFLAAPVGAVAGGYALPAPGIPGENPPGLAEAFWALPGSVLGLRCPTSGDLAAAPVSAGRGEIVEQDRSAPSAPHLTCPPPLVITDRRLGRCVVMGVRGEVDIATVQQFECAGRCLLADGASVWSSTSPRRRSWI